MFAAWRRSACEDYPDTLKLVSLVDFFLPYFPLQREQVRSDEREFCYRPPERNSLHQVELLVVRALNQWAQALWHEKLTQMQWTSEVVAFLTDRVC